MKMTIIAAIMTIAAMMRSARWSRVGGSGFEMGKFLNISGMAHLLSYPEPTLHISRGQQMCYCTSTIWYSAIGLIKCPKKGRI